MASIDYEKQLQLTNIRAKFLKNFDTFGDMDPFVKVSIGKSSNRTETIKKGGKEPQWKTAVTLSYFTDVELKFEAFDEDVTENQAIGQAAMKVSELKLGGGKGEVKLILGKDETGTLSFDYTLKELRQNKHLMLSRIRCELVRKTDYFLKSLTYLAVSAGGRRDVTSTTKGSDKEMSWPDGIRLSFENDRYLQFQLLDANNKDSVLFTSKHFIEEFDQLSGAKEIPVTDANFDFLGVLSFDYQTLNVVTEKQAADNAKANEANANSVTVINFSALKGKFPTDGMDLYLKLVSGSNVVKTGIVPKSKKDVDWKDTPKLYVNSRQYRITVIALQKKTLKDEIVGVGEIFLEELKGNGSTIKLLNREGKEKGIITFNSTTKKAVAKTIRITGIKAEFTRNTDMVGQMDPFVEVKIGGCTERTQTADEAGKNATFTRLLVLKFVEEEVATFDCYDEDLTSNDLIGTGELKIADLTEESGTKVVSVDYEKGSVGKLTLTYQTTNVVKKEEPPKAQQKPQPSQIKKEDTNRNSSTNIKPGSNSVIKSEDPPQQQQQQSQIQQKQADSSRKQSQSKIQDAPPQKPTISEIKPQQKKPSSISQIKNESPKKQAVSKEESPKKTIHERSSHFEGGNAPNSIRQSSLQNMSKRLPPVLQKKNFGDKIFEKQSAMTLQKSIVSYSMPKAIRFGDAMKPIGAEPSYYIDSCFRTDKGKGTGFGYGHRRPYPDWMQRNMKENPAPGAYDSLPQGDQKKGKTFGISYKYYQKVMIPKEQKRNRPKLSPLKSRAP